MSETAKWEVVDRVPMDGQSEVLKLMESGATDLLSMGLHALIEVANAEHAAVGRSLEAAKGHLSAGIAHGIRAGHALNAIKAQRGSHGWNEWVVENTEMSRSAAQNYCRWAYYEDELRTADVPLTVKTVAAYLRELPNAPGIPSAEDLEKIEEIKRLRAEGKSQSQVAELVGVSKNVVYYHTTPGAKEKARATARRHYARNQAGRKALERQERDKAAKKVGGRVDKAYSLIRQACAEIDGAMVEVESGRDDLRVALSHAHKAEDHISAAIRKAS